MIVVALDPGLAHCGWARIGITEDRELCVDWGCITTRKSSRKRAALAVDDTIRRARELRHALADVLTGADLVCAEAISYVRNSAAMTAVGVAWGVIISLVESARLPLLCVSPQEAKLAACGSIAASKEKVAEAMRSVFPNRGGWKCAAGLYEHGYDALAVYHACRDSDAMRMMSVK